MDIREILAINLRKLRQARGLSQEELAHRAEIDRTYISALERSVYAAGIDVVARPPPSHGGLFFNSAAADQRASVDSGRGRVFIKHKS